MKSPHPLSGQIPHPHFYFKLPSSGLKLSFISTKDGVVKCGMHDNCYRFQVLDLLATLSFDEDNDEVLVTVTTPTNKSYHMGSTVTIVKPEPEEDL